MYGCTEATPTHRRSEGFFFLAKFDSGMNPSEARQTHKSKLLLRENGIELISNGSINPTERTIKMWHQGWREKRFGPQIAPLDKIKENMPLYEKAG